MGAIVPIISLVGALAPLAFMGGAPAPAAPPPAPVPQQPPPPPESPSENELAQREAEERTKAARFAFGTGQTIKTSGQGLLSDEPVTQTTILGGQ